MDEMTMKMLMFFGYTSLFGWIFLFVGIGAMREKRRREAREYTRTTGVIVDYVARKLSNRHTRGSIWWMPVVSFTADGQEYRLENSNHMDRETCPVGQTVDVIYDVSDPTHFHLASDSAYENGGRTAMKVAVIWILASAAVTVALAVFVGGASFDLSRLWR